MQIELDVSKKYFFTILAGILILAGIFAVYAFGTSSPSVFGHTASEVENISALFWVDHTVLANYNSLERPGCIPDSTELASKFATSGTVSACNRYCISSSGGTPPGKGYTWGTFVECNTLQAQCLCIN